MLSSFYILLQLHHDFKMTVETENLTEYILVEYRWVVVITVLLPLSLLWKLWSTVRNYVVFKLSSAPKMHEKKVSYVQKQVSEHKTFLICGQIHFDNLWNSQLSKFMLWVFQSWRQTSEQTNFFGVLLICNCKLNL